MADERKIKNSGFLDGNDRRCCLPCKCKPSMICLFVVLSRSTGRQAVTKACIPHTDTVFLFSRLIDSVRINAPGAHLLHAVVSFRFWIAGSISALLFPATERSKPPCRQPVTGSGFLVLGAVTIPSTFFFSKGGRPAGRRRATGSVRGRASE